jgi:hypothetical protein
MYGWVAAGENRASYSIASLVHCDIVYNKHKHKINDEKIVLQKK